LAVPNNDLLTAQRYNELFTMHGTTMIFLAIMPLTEHPKRHRAAGVFETLNRELFLSHASVAHSTRQLSVSKN
jgi:hypothetical protein